MPIVKDVLHDMKNAKIFTKADLSSVYLHVKLDAFRDNYFPDMFGRFRWLRLPFCLNSASEENLQSLLKHGSNSYHFK